MAIGLDCQSKRGKSRGVTGEIDGGRVKVGLHCGLMGGLKEGRSRLDR
jgi:hypothetical protein